MDKHFMPVVACVIAIFLILIFRPSFLVHSADHKECPYCLNPWLVTLTVLIVGGSVYAAINQNTITPGVNLL